VRRFICYFLKGGETGAVGPQGIQGASASYNSIDASSIVLTSTSDALMSGMSKSPEPGTYLVFFNSQYSISPLTLQIS
jgi:hypothetical protein